MISIIVAIAKNRAIGKDNKLLWHLPEDLKRFKKLTEGHIIIMGQKTWNSLPKKPLPYRVNVVITDDENFKPDGAIIATSITDALELTLQLIICYQTAVHIPVINDEVFVVGGSSIYNQFLPLADKLYITQIDKDFEGDVFFPELDKKWKLESEQFVKNDEFNYSYQIWLK